MKSGHFNLLRTTLATLLLAHVASLKGLDPQLKPLLNSKNADERQLAAQLMLKLNMQLPEQLVDSALHDTQGLQPDAIRYLGAQPGPLSTDHLKVLIPILAQPASGEAWNATYVTLQKKQPELLQTFFTQYKPQFDELAKQKPSTLMVILKTLPPQENAEVATWPLLDGNSDDCNIAIVNLMLLERKATIGSDFESGFWTVLQGRQNCSRQERSTELGRIDQTIATARNRERLSSFLLARLQDQHWDDVIAGITALTGWQSEYQNGGSGSEPLQLALAPALAKLINEGVEGKALDLLRLGVPFNFGPNTVDQLVTRYRNQSRLVDE